MARRPLRLLALILPLGALAATGGPDVDGVVYTDSDEVDGPPHAVLDLDRLDAATLALGASGTAEVALPFSVPWYGEELSTAWVGADGVLLFDEPDGSVLLDLVDCPGEGGAWSGVAAFGDDLAAGTVRHATVGRYPSRGFVVEWASPHATAGGEGLVQAWLLEGRAEAVIALSDLSFGDPAVDGGADAFIGVQGGAGTGLAWSCEDRLSDGSSAWFGHQGDRPQAEERETEDLARAWTGEEDFQYAGEVLGGGDLDGDGLGDLVVGDPDEDQAFVVLGGYLPAHGGALSEADAWILDDGDTELSAGIAVGDLDGDGVGDLALGAPSTDHTSRSNVGAVRLLAGGTIGGVRVVDDSDRTLLGDTAVRGGAGAALAVGDVDGDGSLDLVIGAPYDDTATSDAGAVVLWLGGSGALDGDTEDLALHPRWTGEGLLDYAGTAVAAADLDGDGAADIVVGAPEADGDHSGAGRAYLLAGGPGLVGGTLVDEAAVIVQGGATNDRAGTALALGDLDGDGLADLALGVPYYDDPLSSAGGVFGFLDPLGGPALLELSDADLVVSGGQASATAGRAVAVADIDGDGGPDLVVGAPNLTGAATGGGLVGIFTDPLGSSGDSLLEADHRLLGSHTGGGLGAALVVVGPDGDGDGDGLAELWAGAPLDDVAFEDGGGADAAGAVYGWELVPDFQDVDGDGFVSTEAGGLDCDDGAAAVYPSRGEVASNRVDDDCDGWIDDVLVLRTLDDHWQWDLQEELGGPEPVVYDFEDAAVGDDGSDLYAAEGLTVDATGYAEVAASVGGVLPVDRLGLSFSPTASNRLDLVFEDEVDALGLHVLAAEAPLLLTAYTPSGTLLAGLELDLSGETRPGGVFVGLTFSEGIERLRLEGTTTAGWGLDEIAVAWQELTDRDGDGWADVEGDCDDEDDAVHPGATEDLSNGIDDDCDGVVDGGDATVWTDPDLWLLDAGIEAERVDFEEVAPGVVLSDEYVDLGVAFDADLEVVDEVDGAAPRDAQAALALGEAVVIDFEEAQPGVGLYLLDASGDFSLGGFIDGDEVYHSELRLDDEDGDGGTFVGITWDVPVERLVITAGDALDAWGLDDLAFSRLGLDDADGDGYTEAEGDCDDSEAGARPGGVETWYDGIDGDCDGESDFDADGDGHDLDLLGGGDCDDGDAEVSPDAAERWYDGVDTDCDGASDYDADGDGFDSSAWGGDDCDDALATTSPGAEETWYDGVDSDCDGADDYDSDGDGYVGGSYADLSGLPSGDCDDDDGGVSPGAEEAWYDGVDTDCDGASDYDVDGDGYDAEAYGGTDCEDLVASAWPGAPGEACYDGVDTDCDGASDYDCDGDGHDSDAWGGDDCDDADPEIRPGAVDVMGDGIDTDCDGAAEFDDDGDGWDGVEDGGLDCDDADPAVHPGAEETWYDGVDADCAGDDDDDADGDGHAAEAAGGDDCDDTDPTVHPGATDYYYDGVDSDCDGSMDYDGDGDGYPADWYGGDDCDDEDAAIHPDAEEDWYDGVDADCDGASDYDADGDGWDAEGYGGLDCDDADAGISPEAREIPEDGVDQDCDGEDDLDADGDGWGSSEDCDETDAAIHPGAAETWYDGVDADCGGDSDYDADGDGLDAEAWGGVDCDDGDAAVYPGAAERWYDGIDGDCAGDDDYDADADGWAAAAWGGGDCDDADAERNPGVALDDCGGGDEDCDDEVDEDCAGDGGATDGGADGGATDGGADGGSTDGGSTDGGATDGGSTDGGSTDGGSGDGGAGDGGAPDGGEDWLAPDGGELDEPGCSGCATGRGGLGPWLLGLALLGLRRRR